MLSPLALDERYTEVCRQLGQRHCQRIHLIATLSRFDEETARLTREAEKLTAQYDAVTTSE